MATISASVTINVPALPNVGNWFANAASWLNYWRSVPASVEFDGATTTLYVPTAYDATKTVYNFSIDGNDKFVPSKELFDSLVAQLAALDASYQTLRNELKAAGLIDKSQ